MAVKPYLSNGSLLSAKNINGQSFSVTGAAIPIKPLVIKDSGSDFVEIENAIVSGRYSIIDIESAKVYFDDSVYNASVSPLYLMIDDEPGTTLRENIETFNWEKTDIFPHGTTPSTERVEGGPVDAFDDRLRPVQLKFSKPSGGNYGGIEIRRVVDISKYRGMFFEFKVQSTTPPDFSIVVRITEPGGTSYHQYSIPVSSYGESRQYYADFSNPTLEINYPQYLMCESIGFYIYTEDPSTSIGNMFLSNVYGALRNLYDGQTDNKIKIFVSDNVNSGVPIAIRNLGTWEPAPSVDIPGISDSVYDHTSNDNIHIPESCSDAFYSSGASSSNQLITLNESDDVVIDSSSVSRSALESVMRSSLYHSRPMSIINTALTIVADSFKRANDIIPAKGHEGIVDQSLTTAEFHGGFFKSSALDTVISTFTLFDSPFNAENIMVDIIANPYSKSSGIKFDLDLYDLESDTHFTALSDADISKEHNLKPFYDSNQIHGTRPTITIKIPADTCSYAFNSFLTNVADDSSISSKAAKSGSGKLHAYTNTNLRSRENGVWITKPEGPEAFSSLHTHISSNKNGFRLFSRSSNIGYVFNDANESWIASPSTGISEGMIINNADNIHVVLNSSECVSVNETSLVSTSMQHPSVGFKPLGSACDEYGYSIFTNSTSAHLYSAVNSTWISASNPSDSGSGVLAMDHCQGEGSIRVGGSNNVSEKYIRATNSWVSLTPPSFMFNYYIFGQDESGMFFVSDNQISSNSGFSYSPDEEIRIFAIGIKMGFGRITGDAFHVGCWKIDSWPEFVYSTQTELDEGGYWSNNQGLIYGAKGPFWGYFMRWTPDDTLDYSQVPDDEKWKYGFWSNDEGYIVNPSEEEGVPSDAPMWDGECPQVVNEAVWTDDTVPNASTLNSAQVGNNGFWADDNGKMQLTNGIFEGSEWSDE